MCYILLKERKVLHFSLVLREQATHVLLVSVEITIAYKLWQNSVLEVPTRQELSVHILSILLTVSFKVRLQMLLKGIAPKHVSSDPLDD